LLGPDTPAFTQTFDTPNVGTSKTLTPAGVANDGNGGNNYAYTFVPNTTGVIAKATPTLSVTNSPATYNGLSHAAVVTGSVPGVVRNVQYNGSATVPVKPGIYVVTADFTSSDPNYTDLSGTSAGNFFIQVRVYLSRIIR